MEIKVYQNTPGTDWVVQLYVNRVEAFVFFPDREQADAFALAYVINLTGEKS